MNTLSVLVTLCLVDCIYNTFLKDMTVVNLSYGVSDVGESGYREIEIDLTQHIKFSDEN